MARKPPTPPGAKPWAPAPHVQAAVARAAQAKLPVRPAAAAPDPTPPAAMPGAQAKPVPSRPPQADHVRRALAPAQAKLPTAAGPGRAPAPHVTAATAAVQRLAAPVPRSVGTPPPAVPLRPAGADAPSRRGPVLPPHPHKLRPPIQPKLNEQQVAAALKKALGAPKRNIMLLVGRYNLAVDAWAKESAASGPWRQSTVTAFQALRAAKANLDAALTFVDDGIPLEADYNAAARTGIEKRGDRVKGGAEIAAQHGDFKTQIAAETAKLETALKENAWPTAINALDALEKTTKDYAQKRWDEVKGRAKTAAENDLFRGDITTAVTKFKKALNASAGPEAAKGLAAIELLVDQVESIAREMASASSAPVHAAGAPAAAADVKVAAWGETSAPLYSRIFVYNGRRWNYRFERQGTGGTHLEHMAYDDLFTEAADAKNKQIYRESWIGFIQNAAPCTEQCRDHFLTLSKTVAGFVFYVTGDHAGYCSVYGITGPTDLYFYDGAWSKVPPAGDDVPKAGPRPR